MRWRRLRLWRRLAQGLVVALALQWSGQALAQSSASAPAPITRVLILDFEPPAGQPALLGRKAADAVALAFINYAKNYEVVPRSEMEAQMQRLRLSYPLLPSQLVQLTRATQARYAVTGKIVQVSTNPKVGQATVQLQMLWIDAYLEVPMNGAHVRVSSPPRPGTPPDVAIDQALNLAAAQAVQQALAVRLPEGQITQRVGTTVIINRGRDHGLLPGMRMWIVRTVRDPELGPIPRLVGSLTLTAVEARTAEGRIDEESTPVQYPDKVVAVYQLPEIGAREAPVQVKRPSVGAQIARLILTLGAVLLAANLLRRGNTNRGEGTPPPTRAQVSSDGQRVILRLSPAQDTVAIEIYRDTAASVNPTLDKLIDVVDGQSAQSFTDDQTFYTGVASIELDENSPPNILPRVQRDPTQTNPVAPTFLPDTYEVFFLHTPPQIGVSHWYVVRFVTARRVPINPIPAGGTTGGGGTQQQRPPFELIYGAYSAPIGPFTPLRRLTQADLLEPNPNSAVNLNSVTFRFLSAQGADEYIVQVSDQVTFPPNRTLTLQVPLLANPNQNAQLVTLANQNLLPFAQSIGNTTGPFYWRVGYRNSRDAAPPQGGYVFSDTQTFQAAAQPPPPPQ